MKKNRGKSIMPSHSSSHNRQTLRKLAEIMNRRTRSKVPVNEPLLSCMEWVIQPAEAEFLLKMGSGSHRYQELEALFEGDPADFKEFSDSIADRGLFWLERNEQGEERYAVAPMLPGWFELQLCRGKDTPYEREFVRRLNRLFDSWKKWNILPVRSLLNLHLRRHRHPHQTIAAVPGSRRKRKKPVEIPVNKPLKPQENRVYPSKTVFELIEKYGKTDEIALVHCFCRHWRNLSGESCRFHFPEESCLVIGPFTEGIAARGFGRMISKEEALKVIDTVQKAGAVHTVFHERDDVRSPHMAICNCCWDCCGVLGSYNRGIIPLKFSSYYQARISKADDCKACGICEKFCPVGAVGMDGDTVRLNPDLCIGCGQCSFQCPQQCFTLEYRERDVVLPLLKKSAARIPA